MLNISELKKQRSPENITTAIQMEKIIHNLNLFIEYYIICYKICQIYKKLIKIFQFLASATHVQWRISNKKRAKKRTKKGCLA